MLAGVLHQTHFSLSRSGGLALAAVADVPVGVDIQAIPGSEIASDVLKLLHPNERAEIYVGGETRPRSPAGWTLFDLPTPEGYVAAAAIELTG